MKKPFNLLLRHRTPAQKKIHNSLARFVIAVWGRQTGKTTTGTDIMTYKPLMGPKEAVYWFLLQTHAAASVIFERHCRMLHKSKELLARKPHESDLRITFVGNRSVFYKSGEVLENLRNETLNGAIIDECRQQEKSLWTTIIRPMLAAKRKKDPTQGWAHFYSTPNGFDWFYDLYEEAKLHPNEWNTFHSPCTEAPWWTPEEIDSARQSMSESEFAQEIMADFRDLVSGKAYLSFGAHNIVDQNPFLNVITTNPHPALPIIVAMDFNLSPMAWTLGQQKANDFFWYDEIWLEKSHTQEAVSELIPKLIGHKPGVVLVGDATGNAGQRAAAGKSDYDIIMQALTQANIRFINKTPESNPRVKDRVNTMNAAFKSAAGTSHSFFLRSGVPKAIKDFQRVVWKKGAQAILDQTTNPELTHSSDGVGYAHCVLAPLQGINNVGNLRVINRW